MSDPTEAVARAIIAISPQAGRDPKSGLRAAEIPYEVALDYARAAIDAYELSKFPAGPMQTLVNAMSQLLDDMGHQGKCVCGLAKAQAVAAYQPWRDADDGNIMSLAEAERIIDECEYTHVRERIPVRVRPLPKPPGGE
jgi:hypothetical protein